MFPWNLRIHIPEIGNLPSADLVFNSCFVAFLIKSNSWKYTYTRSIQIHPKFISLDEPWSQPCLETSKENYGLATMNRRNPGCWVPVVFALLSQTNKAAWLALREGMSTKQAQ